MAIWRSLSGRLLILTVLFVMVAEVLIFVPSVARYRLAYLEERLEKGHLASLAALAAGPAPLSAELQAQLLDNAEVLAVAMKRDHTRELMLVQPMGAPVADTYDLRDAAVLPLIREALALALRSERRYIGVVGAPARAEGARVEVVVDESELRAALLDYGVRIFWLSLAISAITAGLVFLSVSAFIVGPMRRIVDGVASFRADPEDPTRLISESGAGGEIGRAERELAAMQTDVRAALEQKSRLAALGEAVAKINHDLRNMLASAQLLADRLDASEDPLVRRVGPKLIGSLDRAIRLCGQTLTYGAAKEPPPIRADVGLAALFDEIGVALGFAPQASRPGVLEAEQAPPGAVARAIHFRAEAPPALFISADPDQLFRAVNNLARNALQALEAEAATPAAARASAPLALRLEARASAGAVEIDVADTGPGVPDRAVADLFKPFKTSGRKGGSGLGLAIASELARGHGGSLTLVENGPEGARFRLTLPAEGAAPALARPRVVSAKPTEKV